MTSKMSQNVELNTKQLTIISIVSLILGHLMLKSLLSNEILNLIGLVITASYIYYNTLRKHQVFSFIMVMYFCCLFPYLSAKGGGFNIVGFVCILFYSLYFKKAPFEKKLHSFSFKILLGLFVISSVLGWFYNFTGNSTDLIYSIVSFSGVILLLLISSSLLITPDRIKIFLQLNFILIIYSTIASLNKYLHIITFKTPMMPIYGVQEGGYIEGGGIIGSSPLYGEHSMILIMLFLVFYVNKKIYLVNSRLLLAGIFISFLNVFMSISRSVFMLSLVGVILIYILQFKVNTINISTQVKQITVIILLGFGTLWFVEQTGLGYVFDRVDEIEERNKSAGGINLESIIDGSAFNRKTAFEEGYNRYASKDSWLIGYGWGLSMNNRDAFFVDSTIERTSAHSQIFAILFIFGWLGFIGYFGLIFKLIFNSFGTLSNQHINYENRLFALFFFVAFGLFIFNEIKADSIYNPSYFAATLIFMGLGYSNLKANKRNKTIPS